LPALNLRWLDCHGNYWAKFDPCCWAWRTDLTGREVIARYLGVVRIHSGPVTDPLFGLGPAAVAEMSRENPIEMLDRYGVGPGELAMYVGYAGRDECNIDAQVESFLYRARQLGLGVEASYDPKGHHNFRTAKRLLVGSFPWLGQQLAAYGVPPCTPEMPP
jgi:hypothetical protein